MARGVILNKRALAVAKATKDDLAAIAEPRHAGFKLLDAGGETVMFFHWHKDGREPDPELPGYEGVPKELRPFVAGATHTTYAEVLLTLPDRLAAMGYEKETDAILGEVVGMFGAD